ncbi:RICIN domain-containing protein [Micromonospora sp. WMMA1363]|uniref:RICIN domain-containing protein n=1 Tax=Micromonospora sp. WMMA1363 TaxID=3053985 RepID=UPI00259CAF78|nr:RICIN domain-containing protein [Micromonospora sp. WMMA1363]MDM4722647.1 RICIN domain-containing protein [Micromonospora sp. WMMA1363]
MSVPEGPDPTGTIYRRQATRPGLPRDPLMRAAALVGVVGLLLGAFFAAGVLGGGGDPPALPVAADTPSVTASTPAPSEPAPTGPASPSPTPSAAPTTPPVSLTGPTVFRTVASGHCLGVDGSEEKAVAKLADCTGGPEQRWVANPVGAGLVTLTNEAYGMCLDVEGNNGDDGAKLQQYPCHGEANQQWRLVPTGGGAVLLAALHSGRCARPDDGGTEAGTDIRQTTCAGVPEQQWRLG